MKKSDWFLSILFIEVIICDIYFTTWVMKEIFNVV
jgi:hypothetical protein